MSLWRVSAFGLMLAAAGIPLYIHLPLFASTGLGLDLATVGAVLIGIRLMDFLQDPLLGRMIDRWPDFRQGFAALAAFGMAAGFVMLFTVPPPVSPVLWLAASLVLVFTAYSLGTILFYGHGVALAEGAGGHYRLAAWRETGLLAGVVLAALAPTVLAAAFGDANAYPAFGLLLAAVAVLVWALTVGLWSTGSASARPAAPALAMLREGPLPRLLLLGLVNALPVAITSTLFLFFVEDRLRLPDLAGPFLLMFFLAAGLSAPVWSRLVRRFGPVPVLAPAMVLAIVTFIGAAGLDEGAAAGFAAVCLLSGATLGADMVILPALFAANLSREGLPAGSGFGLWSFAAKLALALAAATVLPALELSGYVPATANSAEALGALTIGYAIVPCVLKLVAIAMVLTLPREVVRP